MGNIWSNVSTVCDKKLFTVFGLISIWVQYVISSLPYLPNNLVKVHGYSM